MEEEIKTIKDQEVWTLIEKPSNAKILRSRWVYTLKCNSAGDIIQFKARLFVQGFRQEKDIQHDQVFSSLVNLTIICLFFSTLVCRLKSNGY